MLIPTSSSIVAKQMELDDLIKYHKDFIRYMHRAAVKENIHNFDIYKYYIENVLPALLQNQKFNLISDFITPDRDFLLIAQKGLMLKTDLSDFVSYTYDRYISDPVDAEEDSSNREALFIMFRYATFFTLNEEACRILLKWKIIDLKKHNTLDTGKYLLNSPIYIEFTDDYNDFVRQWVKHVKTTRKKDKISEHLKITEYWLDRTIPKKVSKKEAYYLYLDMQTSDRPIRFERKEVPFLKWALSVIYHHGLLNFKSDDFYQKAHLFFMLGYTINASPEVKVKTREMAQMFSNIFDEIEYSFRKALNQGSIDDFLNLYNDFPRYRGWLIEHMVLLRCPIPVELLSQVKQKVPMDELFVQDNFPLLDRAIHYLHFKKELPDNMFSYSGEQVVLDTLNDLGVQRTDGMPDDYLLSIFETLV